MNGEVLVKSYPLGEINRREVLRYMGCREETKELSDILDSCINEAGGLKGRACYAFFPVSKRENCLDLGFTETESRDLAVNLKNCKRIILFASTIGIEIDRLIMKYSSVSPVKALSFQAIGASAIEEVCDAFCDEMKSFGKLRPRFSPGYGDLHLSMQSEIFKALSCEKRIGITLNESLLMSPTKSVTAIIGIEENV